MQDAEEMMALFDCLQCNGEGWRWSEAAKREVPCKTCNGLGFREASQESRP